MTKLETFIFDIDGTLADSVPLIIKAFRKAVEPVLKRPLSDDEIIDSFGPDEEGSIRSFIPDEYVSATNDFYRYYEKFHAICDKPVAGMTDLLKMLKGKGLHLAVATGKCALTANMSLERFGLMQYFERFEYGSPVGSRKIEGIHNILHSLGGLSTSSAVYIGDSPNDVKESKAAGVATIGVAWASTVNRSKLAAEHPDFLFNSVAEFAEWAEHSIPGPQIL